MSRPRGRLSAHARSTASHQPTLSRHRRRHVHCAGMGVPVLKITSSRGGHFKYRHAHARAMDMPSATPKQRGTHFEYRYVRTRAKDKPPAMPIYRGLPGTRRIALTDWQGSQRCVAECCPSVTHHQCRHEHEHAHARARIRTYARTCEDAAHRYIDGCVWLNPRFFFKGFLVLRFYK